MPPTQGLRTTTPAREGIQKRTSTHVYQKAFSADESRVFSGIGYELVTTPIGPNDVPGERVYASTVTFSDRPNGLFEYDASARAARFQYNGQVTRMVDDGRILSETPTGLLWYDPWTEKPYSISYLGGYEYNSPYFAYARLRTFNEDRSETEQTFTGGSRTLADDFPPRGFDNRRYVMSAQVLSSEAGGFFYAFPSGNKVWLDFDFSKDRFEMDPTSIVFDEGSGLRDLDLSLTGELNRREASLQAKVVDATSGSTAILRGYCYGPYGEDIHISGVMRLEDGRQMIITIYS